MIYICVTKANNMTPLQTKVEIKKRQSGGIVEIVLPDGQYFRITFEDKEPFIKVQTIEGGMMILPSVSNEIRIQTKDYTNAENNK